MTEFEKDETGLLTDRQGNATAPFVDSCATGIMEFPDASVVILRLYDSARNQQARTVPMAEAHQVRMSAATARRVAQTLLETADALEGIGAPRQ